MRDKSHATLLDREAGGRAPAQPQGQAEPNPIIDILTSPTAKAVLAGIAAMVVKNVMRPRA